MKPPLNGKRVGKRVRKLIGSLPEKKWSELGVQLGAKRSHSKQYRRKRAMAFLHRLEHGKLFWELEMAAKYLEVSVEALMYGRFAELTVEKPPRDDSE